jgi:hypothetical protein
MSDTPPQDPKPGSQLRADPMAILRLLKDEEGHDPKGLPPVHRWNPPFCGDINMEIKRNGQWFYMGTPIGRPALVKLFSSVLRHDDDGDYYLVTPVEKVRIRVEDAPFLAVLVEKHEEGGVPYLKFTTQTGDVVIAGPEHPLRVEFNDEQEPKPYVHVRDRLEALISRNVYYQLVEWSSEGPNPAEVGVCSAGAFFVIGYL